MLTTINGVRVKQECEDLSEIPSGTSVYIYAGREDPKDWRWNHSLFYCVNTPAIEVNGNYFCLYIKK